MNRGESGSNFNRCLSVLFFLALCSQEALAQGFILLKQKVPDATRNTSQGGWLPLPQNSRFRFDRYEALECRFPLPFKRVPRRNLDLAAGRKYFLSLSEGRSHASNEESHHRVDEMGRMAHMAGMGTGGESRSMGRHGSRNGGMGGGPLGSVAGRPLGRVEGGLGNPIRPGNHEMGQHPGIHGDTMGSRYLAKLRRFGTIHPIPGMAMGVSVLGHGPEMWVQYKVQSTACMTFNLGHENHAPQARLSLDMDI